MFCRYIWICLFLLSMGCIVACDHTDQGTVVPTPTRFVATPTAPTEKRAKLSMSEQCAATNDSYYLQYREDELPYMEWSPEFWSPDEQTAVVKQSDGRTQSVVLMYSDGREPIIVRSGISGGLGHPYWSPDSQMFVFTQLVIPLVSEGIDLEIVDTTGNTLWSYSPFPWSRKNSGKNTLEWVPCP